MRRPLMYALLFVAWTAELSLDKDHILYCGLWRSPFQLLGPLLVTLPSVNLFPWQLLLFAMVPVCLVSAAAFRLRDRAMDGAIVVSFASVALTFTWGLLRSGSAYNAYYQLWRFLAALLLGLLLPAILRRPSHLKGVGRVVVAAALVRGTLAICFYWTVVHGRMDPPPPYMTTHDDSLLFVAGVLIVLSRALSRPTAPAWTVAGLVSAELLYAITLNNRRLAWIELLLVLVLVYFLLGRGRVRRRVNQVLLLLAPLLLVYGAVGANRPEPVFAPVRALSTAGSYEDNSSMAREEEIRNLIYTLSTYGNPLLGTGWGIPYEKVTSVYANFGAEWWQYRYMPHNSLLGVAVFAGLVGVAGIWLVVPVAAMVGTRGYRQATRPLERAAAMSAVGILPAYAVQCYGDIGFQSLTGNLILGVALGVAGTVSAWAVARQEERRPGATPRRQRPRPLPDPPASVVAMRRGPRRSSIEAATRRLPAGERWRSAR